MTNFFRVLIVALCLSAFYLFRAPLPEMGPAAVALHDASSVPPGEIAGVGVEIAHAETNPEPVSPEVSLIDEGFITPSVQPALSPQPSPAPSQGGSASQPSSSPAPASPAPTPTSSPTPTPTSTPAPRSPFVVAWMQANDWGAAVDSVIKNAALIREVSPAWYIVNADGTISARSGLPVNDPGLVETARAHDIIIRPLIMSVPGAGATKDELIVLLKNKDLRKKQIDLLVQLAVEEKYDGLDLDFESIEPKNLPDLATYVEDLATALHMHGKTLAVSIETHPNDVVLPSWQRIGKAADNVRLMAYGKQSPVPAPITDLVWMRARVSHALRVIPKEKLTVGLPLYCLRWEGSSTRSSTWTKYHTQTGNVVCENAASVKEKVDILHELGVTDIAFWRLGGEDPKIWENL